MAATKTLPQKARAKAAASSHATRPIQSANGQSTAMAKAQLESLLMPAAKAYLLGYIMDILPAILKALIKYISTELKRIRASEKRLIEERKVAKEFGQPQRKPGLLDGLKPILPSFYRLPTLLQAIAKALLVALGPNGMAISCLLAMAGWRISETLVWWPIAKYYALKLANPATFSEKQTLNALRHARIASTFVASSLSSALAMMMLQHQSQAAISAKKAAAASVDGKTLTIDTTPGWIPKSLRPSNLGFLGKRLANSTGTPRMASLAPAGHFLSRLTSLTLPGTPAPPPPGMPGVSNMLPASPDARVPASPTATLQPLPQISQSGATVPPSSPQPPLSPSSAPAPPAQDKFKTPALGRPSPTIDLTLFALVRGMDTLVRALAAPASARKDRLRALTSASATSTSASSGRTILKKLALGIADQAEGLIFVVCCAQIMWAWFYHPERLPPSYVKWITNLATMDERLLLALRCIRTGKPLTWNYQSKQMTPEGVHLLGSLAEELGHPYQWGDPTRLPNTSAEAKAFIAQARAQAAEKRAAGAELENGPNPGFVLNGAAGPRGRGQMGGMPCELVHCGTGGASCYKNALYRWIRGWRMSMAIYFPVHLLPRLLFNPKGFLSSPVPNLIKVLTGAARSAAFLATYIVGNWFPICLARSALLPRLFPNIPFNFWDAGIGPMLGSIACGFSIFIEEKRKRAEMALYVAPRALFAMVESARPGWLSQGEQTALWAERLTFGAAVGTVVAAARYKPDLLRGITAAMGWVARPPGTVSSGRNYARSQ